MGWHKGTWVYLDGDGVAQQQIGRDGVWYWTLTSPVTVSADGSVKGLTRTIPITQGFGDDFLAAVSEENVVIAQLIQNPNRSPWADAWGSIFLELCHQKYNQQNPNTQVDFPSYLGLVDDGQGQIKMWVVDASNTTPQEHAADLYQEVEYYPGNGFTELAGRVIKGQTSEARMINLWATLDPSDGRLVIVNSGLYSMRQLDDEHFPQIPELGLVFQMVNAQGLVGVMRSDQGVSRGGYGPYAWSDLPEQYDQILTSLISLGNDMPGEYTDPDHWQSLIQVVTK